MKNFFKIFFKSDLPVGKPPKAPTKEVTVAKYLGTAKGSKVANTYRDITSLDLADYARTSGTMSDTIKNLVLTSPDLSNAVLTKIKTAIPLDFTAIAYTPEGLIDPEATKLLHKFISRLNYGSYDYTRYTTSADLRTLSACLLYDSFRYGGMGAELVLGDMRVPAFIKAFSTRNIEWANNTPSTYPIFKGATDIPLNYPTVFYSSSVPDAESPYAESPLQSTIQACLWDTEFVNALRRAAHKNLLQRLLITINTEEYIKTLPFDVQNDKKKLEEHMNATISTLESQYAALNPEDSLVLFDILKADTIQDKSRSEDRSIDVLNKLISGRISAGSKTLPSILGRGDSANAASTESLLFLKAISDSVNELNILLSRCFSLALRLFGFDVYARFMYEEINLRPGLELASFRAMEMSNTLQKLSYGFISDEEASIKLTGTLPAESFKPLSGTGFYKGSSTPSGNDYSNTSVTPSAKPNSTQSQKDNGDTKQTGGK